jgi:hypothetical protein
MISLQTRWSVISFALVFGSLALSWVAVIVLGGFKMGSLHRRVIHPIARDRYNAFWQVMHQRLTELCFRAKGTDGTYIQSGAEMGNMETFTHAKTHKEFRVKSYDTGGNINVELSLRYLDPIVGDSGEIAYRDAVLEYVSGQTDVMRVVPNRTFGTIYTLVGGIISVAAVLTLKCIGYTPVVAPVSGLVGANIVVGILALVAIHRKPLELTGRWLAYAGIALSLIAMLMAKIL